MYLQFKLFFVANLILFSQSAVLIFKEMRLSNKKEHPIKECSFFKPD